MWAILTNVRGRWELDVNISSLHRSYVPIHNGPRLLDLHSLVETIALTPVYPHTDRDEARPNRALTQRHLGLL